MTDCNFPKNVLKNAAFLTFLDEKKLKKQRFLGTIFEKSQLVMTLHGQMRWGTSKECHSSPSQMV